MAGLFILKHMHNLSDEALYDRWVEGLSRWDGLVLFLDDGRIEMDTNSVERAMRPIALNQKNSLFAGHDEGAVNWQVLHR